MHLEQLHAGVADHLQQVQIKDVVGKDALHPFLHDHEVVRAVVAEIEHDGPVEFAGDETPGIEEGNGMAGELHGWNLI